MPACRGGTAARWSGSRGDAPAVTLQLRDVPHLSPDECVLMGRLPTAGSVRSPQHGQALVEFALVSAVMLTVLFAVFEGVWWAYAQNVVTAAVQDGAQRASAQNGDLRSGEVRAQNLLQAGLGQSAALVQLRLGEDAQSVRLTAAGDRKS